MLTLDTNLQRDRVTTYSGCSWAEYEGLVGPEYDRKRISYWKGEIQIVSPGRNHERLARMIASLVEAYCQRHTIRYYHFGSTRLEQLNAAGKEPDAAYAFIADKDKPDLAVEVNVTSGSLDDLAIYRALAVKEVWIWQREQLTFFRLDGGEYRPISNSHHLPGIDSDRLGELVNRGIEESPLDLVR
jgi:Uma2 family endonuclease